jgi:hypothetical protein
MIDLKSDRRIYLSEKENGETHTEFDSASNRLNGRAAGRPAARPLWRIKPIRI